jgi:hypothetical protein
MTLISQENVVAGLEMLKRRLLHLRVKCQYIVKHEPDGPVKDLLLDEMEEEITELTDSVNLLLSLRGS